MRIRPNDLVITASAAPCRGVNVPAIQRGETGRVGSVSSDGTARVHFTPAKGGHSRVATLELADLTRTEQ